jgi:hypothetical protein
VEDGEDGVHGVGDLPARLDPAAQGLPLLLPNRQVGAGEESLQLIEKIPVREVGPKDIL